MESGLTPVTASGKAPLQKMSVLEVRGLHRAGLQEVSLTLAASELVCLSGPSGAGKTLLLRALADLDVSTGAVYLQGVLRERIPATQWRRQTAYLPAESRWWAATVGEHFADIDQGLLTQLGFHEDVVGWTVERLSSGERQRLAVARLLAIEPVVLLLDEPTANLDYGNTLKVEKVVREYLRDKQAACLWVTHAEDQINRIADRKLCLDSDGLHRGTPE
jgi:putative ABC transport system ATP-binding protein